MTNPDIGPVDASPQPSGSSAKPRPTNHTHVYLTRHPEHRSR